MEGDTWNGLSYYPGQWSLYYLMARGLYGYPNTVEEPSASTIRPELAEELPTVSSDGLTYTVKLRSGLRFPDGQPVTAADVKATFEYMLDPNLAPGTGGPGPAGYYNVIVGVDAFTKAMHDSQGRSASTISGITAVDELTTTFRLIEPDGSFLRALAMAWAFIRPVSTPHAITDLPPPFVGPYRLSSHHEGQTATIDREPSWAANVVAGVPEDAAENNIDGVDIEIGVAPDIQLLRIKGNQLDLTLNDSVVVGSDVPAIANDPQYADRFFSTPTAGVYFGIFRVDRPPFEDPRLRQAVNLAIDRSQLVKIRGGEIAASPWSQILPANLLADEPVDVYPATPDVEGAKRLVASTGLDTPIKFTLVIESSRTAVPADAQSVKEALAAVGFDVALQVLPLDVYGDFVNDPTSDYALAFASWGQDYPDAITFFNPLLTCPDGTPAPGNLAKFCDAEFDSAVVTINRLPPGPERVARFAKLSTDTMRTSAPWWPYASSRHVALVSDRIGNYRFGQTKGEYLASLFLRTS